MYCIKAFLEPLSQYITALFLNSQSEVQVCNKCAHLLFCNIANAAWQVDVDTKQDAHLKWTRIIHIIILKATQNQLQTCSIFHRATRGTWAHLSIFCCGRNWLISLQIIPVAHYFLHCVFDKFPATWLNRSAHSPLSANRIMQAKSFLTKIIMWQVVKSLLLSRVIVRHARTQPQDWEEALGQSK